MSAKSAPPAPAGTDDDRDATVVRPATVFMTTQVMVDPTEVVPPRTAALADGEDKDATIIRPTLQLAREADRTQLHGDVLRPLPKRSLALPKGLMLHEYRIERMLGQGGFGITYLATDINLDSQVAIKEYLPEEIAFRASDRSVSPNASQHRDRYRQGLENFLVEARTLASFRHPNIVRVARFFEAHDTAYMVLEYERGRSLKKWWRAQREHGERLLVERLSALLDGLAVVHAGGYLHRDIKPDNIQVRSDDGRFVLLDFGSAGQTVALADQDAVVVTPGYAPIEQYGVGEQGAWTDIYALAATLYWVVADKKPPDAESRVRGLTMAPAAELGRGRFGPQFLAAIDWGLQMDPAARPRDVDRWRERLLAEHLPSLVMAAARRDDSVFGTAARAERSRGERLRSFARRLFIPPAWPLAGKLAALALAASLLVPAMVWGAYRISGTGEALQASALQGMEALAQASARRLEQLVAGNVKLARTIAGDSESARWLVQFDEPLREVLQQRLAALVRSHPELQMAAVADAAGRVRISTAPDPEAQTRALRVHARAMAGGQGFVTGMAGNAVLIAEGVRDPGGIVIGTVLLRIPLDAFASLVDDTPRRGIMTPLLIDGDGVVLHHAQAERRERRLDDPALSAAMLGSRAAGTLVYRAGGNGAEAYAGFAPVRGSRWVVGYTAPRATMETPLQRLAVYLGVAITLAVLVALLVALRVARGIVKPIQRLTAGAHALRAGDFERAQVDIKRRDELGLLARAYNGMVDVLRQRERERERSSSRR